MSGAEIALTGLNAINATTVNVPNETAVSEYTDADYAISESTRDRIVESVPKNTRTAYARQWAAFLAWCDSEGRVSLPATPQTLADYVGHLCDSDMAPSTINQAISAVRTNHVWAGYEGQPNAKPARAALRQCKRARAENGLRNQKQAPPITIEALRAMVGACDLTSRIGIRNRALLVLGLAMMGRRSELAALTLGDVRETSEGLEITIRTSKTDKESAGETIAVPAGSHPLTNPVRAVRDWIDVLTEAGETSGRLLRRVNRHGHIGPTMSGDAINDAVRSLALLAGVPGAETYTAHSLRAGGATVAYAAGVPVSVIAKHGRWDPKSPVVLGYIRAVDRWRDNAMRNVGL